MPAKPRVVCVECNIAPPKYKCPTCLARTCSLACSKAHKRSCTSTAPAPGALDPHRIENKGRAAAARRKPGNNNNNNNGRHRRPGVVTPSPLDPARIPGALPTVELSRDSRDALAASAVLRDKLRDSRARAAMQRILDARDSAAALAAERANPDFSALCDDVLDALGCRTEEGSFAFDHLLPDPRASLR